MTYFLVVGGHTITANHILLDHNVGTLQLVVDVAFDKSQIHVQYVNTNLTQSIMRSR